MRDRFISFYGKEKQFRIYLLLPLFVKVLKTLQAHRTPD